MGPGRLVNCNKGSTAVAVHGPPWLTRQRPLVDQAGPKLPSLIALLNPPVIKKGLPAEHRKLHCGGALPLMSGSSTPLFTKSSHNVKAAISRPLLASRIPDQLEFSKPISIDILPAPR